MKAVALLCAPLVLSAVSLSGSVKDNILEMYPYEPSSDGQKTPPSVITEKMSKDSERQGYVPNCILLARYEMFALKDQERDFKALERRFRQEKPTSQDAGFKSSYILFLLTMRKERSCLLAHIRNHA